ncbi:hypothetical protein GIB67_034215 [Kingdonia uniflora]|uniref:Uncharacterized protein n=1 Tax=Kingdonia uniflora TaxID=39325 RepID=A0A7J7NRV2_9MAGN|nr:hypothetical protein GIB67_034215 [Kingdonia uniflora]
MYSIDWLLLLFVQYAGLRAREREFTNPIYHLLEDIKSISENDRKRLTEGVFGDIITSTQGPIIRMKLTSFKLISLNITPWKHLRVIEKSPQNNKEAFNEVDEIPKSDPSCNSSAPR